MDSELRQVIWSRSRGYCEVCGLSVDENIWAAHHRKLRKHGGQDTPQNMMVLHPACHNGGTRSVHLSPARAYEHGWLVRSHEDPEAIPVALAARRWVFFLHNGDYLAIIPKAKEDTDEGADPR